MDLFYQIKYLTKKAMLTVMGPAELDEHNDPVKRLDREKDERSGGKTETKPSKEYPKKRKFEGDGSSASAKKAATKKAAPKASATKKAPAKKTAPKTTAEKKAPTKKAATTSTAAKKTTSKARNQPG
ncbi:MAG: hypothetical protein HQ526_11620 [Actinobacteria bacterium]|nr:hypothetical protein [Actinomycetota bacterium]